MPDAKELMTTPIRIQLPTGLPVGRVNVYLFPEPEPVLVDTGLKSDESLAALQAGLAGYDLTIADLSRVIVSHHHVDHFGLAGVIASQSQAEIWVLELGKQWLAEFPMMWQKRLVYYRDDLLGKLGLPPEMRQPVLDYMKSVPAICDPVPADRIVTFQAGDHLMMGSKRWQALHTPGHASTLTCFYQPDTRQLLSTDMLLPLAPTPVVERPPKGATNRVPGLPQFLDSLAQVEALDVDSVYPSHGDPFGDHRELIQHQRDRIQIRKAECLNLVAEGYSTVAGLLPKMYAHHSPELRFAGLWMIVGYLDLLKAEGKVEEVEIDGVWHYHAHRD